MKLNMIDEIFNNKVNSRKVAIIDGDKKVTYLELLQLSRSVSSNFKNSSQNVIVYFKSSIEYIIAVFGIWISGRTAIPIPKNLTEREISNLIDRSDSDTVIAGEQKIIDSLNINKKIYLDLKEVNTKQSYNKLEKRKNVNDFAMIVPTSGTTGNPKLVKASHENLLLKSVEVIKGFKFMNDDAELAILPVTTLSVFSSQCLPILLTGGKLVIYNGKLDPKKIGNIVREEHITLSGFTPTLLNLFLQMENVDWHKFRTLKFFAAGGERVPKSLHKKVKDVFGKDKLMPLYGMTETISIVVGNVDELDIPLGSTGKLFPNIEAKIVDDNGNIVPNGEYGELMLKSLSISSGYYKNEKATLETFSDGWLKTGDIAKFDSQNYLYLKGRKKNIIITSGLNVFPEEVEEYLSLHPDVFQSLVYSEPDKIAGEIPVATIVLKKDASVTEKELFDYCRKGLARYKAPKKIYFRKHLTLKGLGKVGRNG